MGRKCFALTSAGARPEGRHVYRTTNTAMLAVRECRALNRLAGSTDWMRSAGYTPGDDAGD